MSRFAAIVSSFILLLSINVFADENPRNQRELGSAGATAQHYVVQMEHTLRPAEKAALAAKGVDVQHVMPGDRYLVRTADASVLEADPNVRSLGTLAPEAKIDRAALRASASFSPFVTVNVRFHDDTTFEKAQGAVAAAGGSIDTPLIYALDHPQRLQVRIAPGAIRRLASDDHVFGVYGRLKAAPLNLIAAQLSHVTDVQAAPYGLDGSGVTLSMFEPGEDGKGAVDGSHKEFGGRVTVNDTSPPAQHGTHVAGTMIASGVDPSAKGMAPAAKLQDYALDDNTVWDLKEKTLPTFGVVGDNNSWGFQLGWQYDGTNFIWFDALEYFGGYDGFYSAPYDKIARESSVNVLFVHSAGNDGDLGSGPENGPYRPHKHVDNNFNIVKAETFCISANGSGNDCPAPTCSAGISTVTHEPHCEKSPHTVYGPYGTISFIASEKNVLSVGAIDLARNIASFSSRGPAKDGRIKPDVVAKGVHQYSTLPGGAYGYLSGTSMSSPVVTGITALIAQQWRTTFGSTPTPEQIKMMLIAGADDIGNAGPDYIYGYGLVNAKASIDTIIADNKSGARIRNGSLAQGDTVQIPLTVTTPGKLRVVLGWADPEVVLTPDELADKTLVNDLDLKVIDPSGATALPYVLDKNDPSANATRGVNTVDNTEEVEIANAQTGSYTVVLTGTKIATGPTQDYVLVANQALSAIPPPCGDPYEPNNTAATAFKYLISGDRITARSCSVTDLDFYVVRPTAAGPLSVNVQASDTELRVTISGNGITAFSQTVGAGQSTTLSTVVTPGEYTIEIEPVAPVGSNATYTLLPAFSNVPVRRTRRASH